MRAIEGLKATAGAQTASGTPAIAERQATVRTSETKEIPAKEGMSSNITFMRIKCKHADPHPLLSGGNPNFITLFLFKQGSLVKIFFLDNCTCTENTDLNFLQALKTEMYLVIQSPEKRNNEN